MKQKKESRIWFDMMLTLLPLSVIAFFYYGAHFMMTAVLCVITALVTEIISVRLMQRKFMPDDLSCTADGLLVALMLPASVDYRIAVLSSVFAVAVAKNIFGGRQNMIFSPSAAAYIFAVTSWGRELSLYPSPHNRIGITETAEKLSASASHIFNTTGKMDYTDFEIIMGNFSGACGSVCILLLLVAAAVLICRNDISGGAFFGTVFGTAVPAFIAPIINSRADSVKYSLVTNMVIFAAVYIIADKRTAPRNTFFAFFYGFFIAAVSYILILTTAKENTIITVSVLFTPIALAFQMLEGRIERAEKEQAQIGETVQ